MVHNASQITIDSDVMTILINTPFEQIPIDLIRSSKDISIDEYVQYIPYFNSSCWNVGLSHDGRIRAIAWGTYLPLEHTQYIHRIIVEPKYRKRILLHALMDVIFQFGESAGATRAIGITKLARSWVRLISPKCEMADAGLLVREFYV